ncbi:motility protein A [Pseudarthrobacter phenanthrenivorans]|uniref:Motility protein A n=1 Tax=Pseudarthrobacter phenanthrenivorans TaxID=361575 RepID=A0A3B0F3P8_PSEPS|nr:MotA/TolQ/ExbB proton channel family protein [Pseudarthrobacter phenanthrenivorans]RKO21546.1 motility protein A [Pseudarthrobacter phenanthrenivorans]
MDPATFIGLLLAFGSLYAMITLEGSSVQSILLPAPMIMVLGGTLAVGLAGTTMREALRAFKSLPKAFMGRTTKPQESIDQIVVLAEKARSEGLLALEEEAGKQEDPFLRGALQNVADGTDGEDLRIMLEDEIATKAKSDHACSKFFMGMGGYAPTIGIIGTVVSLTHVLENLSKPDELGHMIAAAFVATLWGLLSANFIWLPLGSRVAKVNELELARMQLLMEGVLAIQAGSQPLLLQERLRAMVPAHALPKEGSGKKGAGKDSVLPRLEDAA